MARKFQITRSGDYTYCRSCNTTLNNQQMDRSGIAQPKRIKIGRRKGAQCHNWNSDREKFAGVNRFKRSMTSLILSTLKKSFNLYQPLLDYSRDQLRKIIEDQFLEGMSWDNHGLWQIDHIIPLNCFVKAEIYDPKIVNALCNLRPLWRIDNSSMKFNATTVHLFDAPIKKEA